MKPSKPTTKPYTRRSESYKAEALKLADRIGYTETTRQLGLHESQLYGWRAKQSHFNSATPSTVNQKVNYQPCKVRMHC